MKSRRRVNSTVMPTMRVFHFVNEHHGLDNLCKRRLKVATLNELNDPFEFFGVNLGDKGLRHDFGIMKNEMALKRGLLCFSRTWHNPVVWSHYADRHTGLCLGFDVPDQLFAPVFYSRKRLVVEPEAFVPGARFANEILLKLFFTKYSHWRYENEVRGFVTLQDKDPLTNLYFSDFGDDLRLAIVIVGAQSSVTRAKLHEALGDLAPSVETFKARLAFKTFRVVRQRNHALWA
jgi:hypothetical protein